MKTKTIVLIIIVAVISVLGIVSFNAFKTPRHFTVLVNDKLNICFLVDDRYKVEIEKYSFKYSGGKNSGLMTLEKSQLSSDINEVEMNGFKAGYKKSKNLRVYEYKLSQKYILRDKFVNAGKMPVNLVPYRDECLKIKEKFSNHIQIFKEAM